MRTHQQRFGSTAQRAPPHTRHAPRRARLVRALHAAGSADLQPADRAGAGSEAQSDEQHRSLRSSSWPQKSSLFLFRTDGKSCSRELVTGTGRFHFAHPSTQQHLLVWRDRPRVVMVIKKLGRELTDEFLQVAGYLMEAERMHVVVEPSMYEAAVAAGLPVERLFTFTPQESDRLADFVDFVVCLGGDGVILHASSLFKRHIPPVVSFHLGSMGFLTNHNFNDYKRELRQVIYGYQKLATCSMDSQDLPPNSNHLGVMITLRMRLECSIVRAGQGAPEQVYEVLNEIVVDRGSNSFLTNIEAYIGGRFITRVQADGIMLATPTGSTAYSVAAGGSMVHPNVQAILLTPICPHSLNFRPILLPDYTELELRVPDSARVSAWVCFDGKQRQELHRGDSVFIKMSENPLPTINRTDLTTDWFESLERCFRWSNRPEQKPFQDDWVLQAAQSGTGTASSDSSMDLDDRDSGAAAHAGSAAGGPGAASSSAGSGASSSAGASSSGGAGSSGSSGASSGDAGSAGGSGSSGMAFIGGHKVSSLEPCPSVPRTASPSASAMYGEALHSMQHQHAQQFCATELGPSPLLQPLATAPRNATRA